MVNGKSLNIPSYLIKVGDQVTLKEKSREMPLISESLETVARRGIPQWLELDRDNFAGNVMAYPVREDLTMPIEEQLIVELYSK
jgi:small subunit ribosomal protein S4